MKKLLVALLLLALTLTSCSTADGGGTSGTPDTTAPEITTDGITTAEETTEAETTTAATEYIEPEGIILSEALGKWYFDWMPPVSQVKKAEQMLQGYSEEDFRYVLKTPILYREERNGLKVEICFFREYYKLGEPVQVRITVQNQKEEAYIFKNMPKYGSGLSGQRSNSPYGAACTSDEWLSPEDRLSYNMEPAADEMLPLTLLPGEATTIERVIPWPPIHKRNYEYFYLSLDGWGDHLHVPVSVVLLPPDESVET